MKKFLFCFFIILLLTSCSKLVKEDIENPIQEKDFKENINITTPDTEMTTAITPEIAKNISLENNDLLINLQELSKSPRRYDTEGEQRALNFLIDKMMEYGYKTQTQELFVYKRTLEDVSAPTLWQYFDKYSAEKDSIGKATNLIATTSNQDGKKTLYITAHYDTTKDTNGIRDNGSGVVTVMEIARQLMGVSLPINIVFIFFSAEEIGMQGSTYFVSQLSQEERVNALGCINIDVVGEKGDNELYLKTFGGQINVLSLLMDDFHRFSHSNNVMSDHTSFYMGEIPAIYIADKDVLTTDNTNNPLDELDIEKLKKLVKILCEFLINFNMNDYNNLIKSSFVKEYTDLPETEEVSGYTLIQVNKVLKGNGAGSNKEFILKNSEGNQVIITEEDSRFLDDTLKSDIQNFNKLNDHAKYKAIYEAGNRIIIQYRDEWLGPIYNTLEGNISKDEALELLNNQDKFTKNGTLVNELD